VAFLEIGKKVAFSSVKANSLRSKMRQTGLGLMEIYNTNGIKILTAVSSWAYETFISAMATFS
jgi:hypothetical protein